MMLIIYWKSLKNQAELKFAEGLIFIFLRQQA